MCLRLRAEVRSGVLDLLIAVEQRAVVDSHRVGVLVLDDGAVHERAEVLERLVVELGGGDPRRHCLGQLRRELVHARELVGDRRRQLLAGGALGDPGADLLGQRQLPAQVLCLAGADSEVGADGGEAVLVVQAGAGLPAVAKLLLLVDEAEVFAGVVDLRLDAARPPRARARGRAAARSGF